MIFNIDSHGKSNLYRTYTCYSSLKLSDLIGYLDATDREPERTEVAVHAGAAIAEDEAVGAAAARAQRPVVAFVISIVGIAVDAAVAGSREKHLMDTRCV